METLLAGWYNLATQFATGSSLGLVSCVLVIGLIIILISNRGEEASDKCFTTPYYASCFATYFISGFVAPKLLYFFFAISVLDGIFLILSTGKFPCILVYDIASFMVGIAVRWILTGCTPYTD